MKNQQGAPEALTLAGAVDHWARGDYGLRGDEMRKAAAELRRLHYENERLAALVDAQQPAPSAAAASKAVLAAIRAANMQLVRTGDDEFMLVTLKQATPQADSQPALPEITAEDRLFLHYNPNINDIVDWIQRYANAAITADRAARAPADGALEDTARYEYLRDCTMGERSRLEHYSGPALDVVIDAARKQGGQHGAE